MSFRRRLAAVGIAGLLVSWPSTCQTTQAEAPTKDVVLTHLKTSREFTLAIARQMPTTEYSFRLTPQQMTFAEQMVHLASDMDVFLAPLVAPTPDLVRPVSMEKQHVLAYLEAAFDRAIKSGGSLDPRQMTRVYRTTDGPKTGLGILLGLLDHNTHHRASASMYLRAKGITPAAYRF